MIRVRLEELLRERGLTLTELSRRVDITVANLSILKTGKARAVRFSTLEALCRELDCSPGDLLRYEAPQAEGVGEAAVRVPGNADPLVGRRH